MNVYWAMSDSQIDTPQRGCPKRAELPDVNINTGAQSIDTERASLTSSELYIKKKLVMTALIMHVVQGMIVNILVVQELCSVMGTSLSSNIA